jgi:hypothetical protein
MSSYRQMASDGGFYVPLATLVGSIYARTEPTTNDTGANGGSFSTARWAATYATGGFGNTTGNPFLSSINAAGAGILRDMGRTVVSANRTFRKIQLVTNLRNSNLSTFGVSGAAGTNPVEDYLTGYIELGFEGVGQPAPVAHYGR